jgi:soluble lytic murein transglycosylase
MGTNDQPTVGRVIELVVLASLFLATQGDAPLPPNPGPPSAERIDISLAMPRVKQSDVRDSVVSMVRRHRPTVNEDWCHTLADAIYDESIAASVDPLLVASIVAVESSFQSEVVSTMGAVGLMQLRPFVAEAVADRISVEWKGTATLHEPHMNVRLGVEYYRALLIRFDGDRRVALTAFNHGPTRVSRWIRAGTFGGSEYATRVLTTYEGVRRVQRRSLEG